jgi:arabinofuranan 3-O-arabinosyltransferase
MGEKFAVWVEARRKQCEIALWSACALSLILLVAVSYHQNEAVDFRPVWEGVTAFLHGGHPYSVNLFVYPPSSLLLFAPIGFVGFDAARLAFILFDAALILVAAALCLRLFQVSRRSLMVPVFCLAVILSAPVGTTIHLGNVNGLVFAGECAFLLAAARERWAMAGWLLGLTLAIKPVLAPLLLLFVFARQWGAIARAALLPCALSAVALFFAEAGNEFFTITVPFLLEGNASDLQGFNMSLEGTGNALGVPSLVIGAVRAASVALVGLLLWLRMREREDSFAWLLDATGLVLIATLLAFSFSWSYYALYLVPVLVLIATRASRARRWALWPALFLIASPDVFIWRHSSPLASDLATVRVTAGLLLLIVGFAAGLLPQRLGRFGLTPSEVRPVTTLGGGRP